MSKKGFTVKPEFTLEETNTVLESLGNMPFMRVYRIIEKIHLAASQGDNSAILMGGLPPNKKKKQK